MPGIAKAAQRRDGMVLVVVSGPVGGDTRIHISHNNTIGRLVEVHLRRLGYETVNIRETYKIRYGCTTVDPVLFLHEIFSRRTPHLKVKINLRPGVPSARTTETLLDKMRI